MIQDNKNLKRKKKSKSNNIFLILGVIVGVIIFLAVLSTVIFDIVIH